MRVTGGRLRGRVLPGRIADGVRPTSAKVREALFSMIGHDLSSLTLLDAFGGSGLMGLEAHSRGATVLITEKRRSVARQIQQAMSSLNVEIEVRCVDAVSVLASGEKWDIVFLDPPYRLSAEEWVGRASECAQQWVIVEHAATQTPANTIKNCVLDRRRRYGDSTLSLYRVQSSG